jgi:signal transduction histidine kinase
MTVPVVPHPGERLQANKERILSTWEGRLRNEVAAAARQPHPILINTLPALLDQLAEAFSPAHTRRLATEGSTIAHEHGGERVRLTDFRLEELVAEYKILRQVLFDVLEETAPLSREERQTLDSSIDQALLEACTSYSLVQASFRDQFFALLAHDLRTPLTAAQSGAALIVRDPHGEQVARWGRVILDNIGRVDRMVRDLLDTMRVQTGARLVLDIEACDLVAIVRQTLGRFEAEHGDRLVLTAPETMPAHVAPEALSRALENLITNAVKYGDSSRPITVTLVETHGRVILGVHNEGAHIPAEKQETLFRAFQRLTAAEESGKVGWGLGLAQVRAVAEGHGGSIAVDSLPERGTTFIIDIPVDARPYQHKPITPAG